MEYEDLNHIIQLPRFEEAINAVERLSREPKLIGIYEFCGNGDLWSYLKKSRLDVGRRLWLKWARQLADCLRVLRAVGVIHHDIKPHNIMVIVFWKVFHNSFQTANRRTRHQTR